MTSTEMSAEILRRLEAIRVRCPEFRFGQLIAAIGTLAEDESETSLWDIEDADFLAALDRFAEDLAKRHVRTAEPAAPPEHGAIASAPASIVSLPRQVS